MEFEFDPAKSEANKAKHGIDFVEAQRLWLDNGAVRFPSDRFGEKRWGLIARSSGKVWTVFFTIRDGIVRIISVRRARVEEVIFYEGN
ncbi:MAG: BrnT family toxin [Verrucomicrobia bacterium]|nr:BrnT family toxin [Verrucomicrobiota bacterium]